MTINIGHRGAAGLEPENTLRSFKRAEAVGAQILELDLRATSDGYLVIMHDATVDRTTNGSGSVSDMTLEEVRRLDAGMEERVPTFEEVLQNTSLPLQVEVKAPEAVELLVKLLGQQDVAQRISAVTSFDPDILVRMKSAVLDMPLGIIFSHAPSDAAERARSLGAVSVGLRATEVDEHIVKRCQDVGLTVGLWTVNDPDDMRRCVRMGPDAITTDRPDILTSILAEQLAP